MKIQYRPCLLGNYAAVQKRQVEFCEAPGVINCPKKCVLKYGQFKGPCYLPALNEGVCLEQQRCDKIN